MTRAERLLALLQRLRTYRRPVSADRLAADMAVSRRTVYRDIGALVAQGAPIEGEAGVGFVLRPGFTLPPLMFTRDEAEAVALGIQWVAGHGDQQLSDAARNAMAKVLAVVPPAMRDQLDTSPLIAGGGRAIVPRRPEVMAIRSAIRAERKLRIGYLDLVGISTRRTIWPVALTIFEQVQLLAAWCELRKGFRHFRIDRITAVESTDQPLPRRRAMLVREWRRAEGVPDPL